jgi:hypothetical protein
MSLLKYLTFGNKNSYTLNENQQSKSKTGGDKRGLEECSQPPKKRLKPAQSDSKELSKDQKYEEKRERKFLDKWLSDFPWLLYKEEEDLMFCQILSEYANVKVFLRDLSQTDNSPSSIYKSLLKKPNIPNMRKLVELMLVISPSTAECERGFSQMKLIKTELRNSLTDDSLRILMTIKHHGPSLEDFNADRAINYWLGSCKGTRHVGGHAKHA